MFPPSPFEEGGANPDLFSSGPRGGLVLGALRVREQHHYLRSPEVSASLSLHTICIQGWGTPLFL